MGEVQAADAESDPWRWVVMAAAFLTMLMNAAVSYNVGVLNVAILGNYADVSVETVSWLMAVYSAAYAITGPVASAVVDLSNVRTCVFLSGILTWIGWVASSFVSRPEWLFLTLSIVGLGQSMAQLGGSVGMAFYFPTRTVFASGIALSGNGLGSFMHPALLQILLDEYSMKGAFLILGAVCLNSCTCGLLMRPTEFEEKRRHDMASKSFSFSLFPAIKSAWRKYQDLLTDLNFLKFLVTVFAYGVAYNSALVFLPECLINSKGFSHMEAATIASFVGIGSLFARFLVGFAATETKIGDKLMYIGLNVVSFFVCMMADYLMESRIGAYVTSLAYGFYASPCIILTFSLTFCVLGYEKGNSGYGIVMMVYGIASLVGPPIYAFVLQTFGYNALFKITGISFFISAVVCTHVRTNLKVTIEEENCEDDNDEDAHLHPISAKNKLGSYAQAIDAIFGSRNFEFVVPAPEDKTPNGSQNAICQYSDKCSSSLPQGHDAEDNIHVDLETIKNKDETIHLLVPPLSNP